jgi:hypothetical protein
MSTATLQSESIPAAAAPHEGAQDYRAVCSAAVTSCVIAVIGLSAFWLSELLLIPIVSLLLGIYAWLAIRSRRDELTGMGLARAAIFLSVFSLAAAGGFHAYVYATEVPAGYERISYQQLKVDPTRAAIHVPDSAQALDGKKVFIKGYILDTAKLSGIKSFFLVRDKGDCCFGGNPAIDQRILVELDNQMISYTNRQSTVIGEFKVAPEDTLSEDGTSRVLYTLKGKVLE